MKRTQKFKIFPVFAALGMLVVLAGASFGIAYAWHMSEEAEQISEHAGGEPFLAVPPDEGEEPQPDTAPAGSPETTPEPEQTGDETPADAESPESYAARPQYPYALAASETPVDNSYFDDAIFFGDSISTGIPLYGVMPNADVIAFTGINTNSVNTREVIDTGDGERETMLDAAKRRGAKKKVYIMLGANGLEYDRDSFLSGYREFIQAVKRQYPGAAIYLQSMTPVTDGAWKNYPSVSNEKIDDYNLGIMELAREQGVYYLDVAAAMVDENGKLPAGADSGDGMHLSTEYYFRWFDYLKSHAVEVPK